MNLYAEVIDILTEDLDWKSVCVEIAKSNPSVLIKATDKVKRDRGFDKELIRGLSKVGAIKLYRSHTGKGLRESKIAIESMKEELGEGGS